jgi:hypothetical protein
MVVCFALGDPPPFGMFPPTFRHKLQWQEEMRCE